MNLSNNNSYIIDMPLNKVWNITHTKNFGIVYRNLLNNQWSTYSSLEKQCDNSFATLVLSKNRICLIYQNTKGNICINIFCNGKWTSREILRLKGNSFKKVNINALYYNDKIHIFYTMKLSPNSREAMFYQSIDEHFVLSKPIVVDKNLISIKNSFSISLLDDGSLVVVYQKFSNSYILGYRTLSTLNNTLSDFYTIDKTISPFEDFSLCCNNNTIHVLYVKNMSSKNSLIHCSGYLYDLNYITIFENMSKISHPCFFNIGDIIWDMWISNNSIYYCFSKDNGINISNIEQEVLPKNIYKTTYLTFSNNTKYIKNTDNNCLYVDFDNSVDFFPKQLVNSLKSIENTRAFFHKNNTSSSDIEKYVSTVENKFSYYDKKLSYKNEIINQLNFLLNQEKNKYISCDTKLKHMQKKLNTLINEKSKLELHNHEIDSINSELKTKLSIIEKSKILDYENTINSLNSKLLDYKKTITSLNSKVSEYKNTINNLNSTIEQYKANLTHVNIELNTLKTEFNALKKHFTEKSSSSFFKKLFKND